MYLKFLKIVPNLDSMLSILHSWMAAAWGPLKLSCTSGCYIEFSQFWRSSLGGWKHDVGGLESPSLRRDEAPWASREDGLWYNEDGSVGGQWVFVAIACSLSGAFESKSQFRSSNQLRLSGGGRRKFTCCTRQHTETWLMMSHPHPLRHITTTNANTYREPPCFEYGLSLFSARFFKPAIKTLWYKIKKHSTAIE